MHKHRLIDPEGQPDYGLFDDSVGEVNHTDYDYLNAMGKPASRMARRFHYKQFQYFGVVSDELLIGCALAHTGYLGMAFFYVFDIRTKAMREYTWRSPLGRGLKMGTSPLSGESRFQQGRVTISMGYREDESQTRRKFLELACPGLALHATLREPPDYQPMSLCTRTGISGWTYANKVAGVEVEGVLEQSGESVDLASLSRVGGHHDFSAGYMRRETFWNWACLTGRTEQGQRLGLNVSCGVNETVINENCLWLDGRKIKVDGTHFQYSRRQLEKPWRVLSTCGQVDLTFTPLGRHKERLNVGLFASNFSQLFGRFEGHITPRGETAIAVRGLHGFVEEQYAKW